MKAFIPCLFSSGRHVFRLARPALSPARFWLDGVRAFPGLFFIPFPKVSSMDAQLRMAVHQTHEPRYDRKVPGEQEAKLLYL